MSILTMHKGFSFSMSLPSCTGFFLSVWVASYCGFGLLRNILSLPVLFLRLFAILVFVFSLDLLARSLISHSWRNVFLPFRPVRVTQLAPHTSMGSVSPFLPQGVTSLFLKQQGHDVCFPPVPFSPLRSPSPTSKDSTVCAVCPSSYRKATLPTSPF